LLGNHFGRLATCPLNSLGDGGIGCNSVTKERSMKLKVTSLAATFLLGLIPAVCPAQDFSADVVYLATSKPDAPSTGTGTSAHRSSKLYVSKDKMRLETRGLTGTILLVNGGEDTAVALFPLKKAFQPLASGPSEYFRVEDAENACPDWQKAADQKIVCEKVGHEVVDGRQTVKYRNKGASDAAAAAVWIDLVLKFVVKWEGAGTGAELRNVKEGQQAADLFVVPSDYKVLKPQKATQKGFSPPSR
jgi:hypothetical protein